MNIDNAPGKSFEHRRFQNAHEPRENDQFDSGLAQHSHECLFALRLQLCSELTGRKERVWNPELSRDVQDSGVEDITIEDDGTLTISAVNGESAAKAKEITKEASI